MLVLQSLDALIVFVFVDGLENVLRASRLRVQQVGARRRLALATGMIGWFDQLCGSNGAQQLRESLANTGVQVDVDALHVPLNVEKPFGTVRVQYVPSAGMHQILSAGHAARVEDDVRRRGRTCRLPARVRLLEVLGETEAEAFERARTDDRSARARRDGRFVQREDEKVTALVGDGHGLLRGQAGRRGQLGLLERNGDA